jgi:spore coat polysaccharide biosynthesis predicted glycosyltransferase SpsG
MIAETLENRDIASVVNAGEENPGFRRAIAQYVEDTALRRARHESGRELIDGYGTERIHTELIAAIHRKSGYEM